MPPQICKGNQALRHWIENWMFLKFREFWKSRNHILLRNNLRKFPEKRLDTRKWAKNSRENVQIHQICFKITKTAGWNMYVIYIQNFNFPTSVVLQWHRLEYREMFVFFFAIQQFRILSSPSQSTYGVRVGRH